LGRGERAIQRVSGSLFDEKTAAVIAVVPVTLLFATSISISILIS